MKEVICMRGLPGSGKTTYAKLAYEMKKEEGYNPIIINRDTFRKEYLLGLSKEKMIHLMQLDEEFIETAPFEVLLETLYFKSFYIRSLNNRITAAFWFEVKNLIRNSEYGCIIIDICLAFETDLKSLKFIETSEDVSIMVIESTHYFKTNHPVPDERMEKLKRALKKTRHMAQDFDEYIQV